MIIKWKPLVVNLLISLGVGAASALFTMNNMKAVYADLNLPPLSPASMGVWYRLDDSLFSNGHFRLHGLYLGRKQRPQTQCAYHLWRSADIQSALVNLLF